MVELLIKKEYSKQYPIYRRAILKAKSHIPGDEAE